MKKLTLKKLNLKESEILSREQLKKVLGGTGSGDSTQCIITSINSITNEHTVTTLTYGDGWTCSAMSSDAQTRAGQQQMQCGSACNTTYDCGCDGWGS